MAAKETVIIRKWVGSTQVDQDLTPHYDALTSHIDKMSWVRKNSSTLKLRIPAGDGAGRRNSYVINDLLEVWIGDRDGSTWTKAKFIGYIGPWREWKQGGMIHIEISLLPADHDFATQDIYGWPRNITETIPVGDEDQALLGYPPNIPSETGFPLSAWIEGKASVGGYPHDGVLTEFCPGYAGGGIDSALANLTFDVRARPTRGDVPGFFAVVTVEQALDEIVKCATFVARALYGQEIRPVYWVRAIIDPDDTTKLKAQFRMRDLGALGTVDMTFTTADTLSAGQYRMMNLVKSSDPTDMRGAVAVFGAGSEIVGPIDAEEYRLVFSRADYQGEFYPAPRHKLLPGKSVGVWAGEPVVQRDIETTNQADTLAQILQTGTKTPRRQLTFSTPAPVEEGMLIRVIHSVLSLDVTLPVTSVTENNTSGRRIYNVVAGMPKPTISDILGDNTVNFILLKHPGPDRTFRYYSSNVPPGGGGSSSSSWAGGLSPVGGGSGLTSTPNANFANTMQAMTNGVTAMNYMVSTNARLMTGYGLPIHPQVAVANGALPLVPVDTTYRNSTTPMLPAIMPKPVVAAWGPNGELREWQSGIDNSNHPYTISLIFYEDGWQAVGALPFPMDFTTVVIKAERDENGAMMPISSTITLTLRKGVLVGSSWTYGDTVVWTAGAPAATNFGANKWLHIDYNHSLICIAAGIPSGHSIDVEISEKDPNPVPYGGKPVTTP